MWTGDPATTNLPTRLKILNNPKALKKVLKNAVFVERQYSKHHKGQDAVIFYACIKDGDKYCRLSIQGLTKAGAHNSIEIDSISMYTLNAPSKEGTIKKSVILPSSPSKTESVAQSAQHSDRITDMIRLADLLKDVNDTNGTGLYVDKDGHLQFDHGIFLMLPTSAKHYNMEAPEPLVKLTPKTMEESVRRKFGRVAKDIKAEGNTVSLTLPSNYRISMNLVDESIKVSPTEAKRDYGRDVFGNAVGSVRVTDREAVITLTAENVEGTIHHETMLIVLDLFLTTREKQALLKECRTIEDVCEAYRHWELARMRRQGTRLGKIWAKINDIAHRLLAIFEENEYNVYRKVSEGQVWERQTANKQAQKMHYMENPVGYVRTFLYHNADKLADIVDKDYRDAIKNGITVERRPKDWNVLEYASRILQCQINKSQKLCHK